MQAKSHAERHIERPLKERSPMLSLGSASHPPPRRLNTNRTLKREGSTIEGLDTTEEVPPKTERAAAPSSDTPRLHKKPEPDTTPRAAGKCCALFERCPKGNHSVLNLTRATPRDPKAPRPRSPRPAQSSAHSRTRGRRFLGRWHRGHPPAAPAQAALSLGRLPTAIGSRWPSRLQHGEKHQPTSQADCNRFLDKASGSAATCHTS